jgi:galactonate dehydratase
MPGEVRGETPGEDGQVDAAAAAASAIDMALWDLQGQQEGQPLVNLLGLVVNDPVPLYANINRRTADRSPKGFADSARRAAASGFGAIKIAPFDGLTPAQAGSAMGRAAVDAGMTRIAAVREAIGPEATLLVDCHWRLDTDTALALMDDLARLGLAWFECPLPETAAHFADIRRLRSAANDRGIRLAGGERQTGLSGFTPMLEAGLYDVIMPDVKYAGGLAGLHEIAEFAFRRGTLVSPHNPTGPIAHAVSLHVAASLPGMPFLEMQLEESPAFFDLADDRLPQPEFGRSPLPAGHGIGVGLRPFPN